MSPEPLSRDQRHSSPAPSTCSLQKAEDLCRRRKPEQALPYLFKAMEDPNNLDAIVQMAFLMPTIDMGVGLLEEGEVKGTHVLVSHQWVYSSILRSCSATPNSGANLF